ncbi:MAG: efflux RND transporter permease subunit, partial [Alphaproteobacteria bacterium]
MDLIRLSIARPVAVAAVVLLVVLFGLIALARIPIQLAPDVRQPVVTIETSWPGASPAEVEREILLPQEDVLKGLEGVREVSSQARLGRASITLDFDLGTNMDRALLLVANRLDEASDLPDEAGEPTLSTAGNEDSPIAWMRVVTRPGNDRPIDWYGDVVDNVVKDRLERIAGVARANVFGGRQREVRIVVDPYRMAAYGLTIAEVARALRGADASVSAGWVDEGKRRYVVRVEGDFDSTDDVANVVLRAERDAASRRVAHVVVGDIGRVVHDYDEPEYRGRAQGLPAMSVNIVRETGANVLTVMAEVRRVLGELNDGALARAGLQATLTYDETTYIDSAIGLVRNNIWLGGVLAVAVLMVFLRSLRATVTVGLAIPISIIGTFVAMVAVGRSINVISLAGIAFAVGMVVDASIVVLESIFRQRERGHAPAHAAHRGTRIVWGAVLGSTLTTVAAFAPILAMTDEVGQLFRDIAVAISVAVLLSLVVAVTVIPALVTRLLGGADVVRPVRLPLIDAAADRFADGVLGLARACARSRPIALALVVGLTGLTALGTWLLLPPLEYLPEGNRNLVIGSVQTPPGYNLDTAAAIGERIQDKLRPLWAAETGPEAAAGTPPRIEHVFVFTRPDFSWIGLVSADPE